MKTRLALALALACFGRPGAAARPSWDLGTTRVQAVVQGYARDPKSGHWDAEVELRLVNTDARRRFHGQVLVEFSLGEGTRPKRWQTFVSLSPRTVQHRRVQAPGMPCGPELAQCPPLRVRVGLPGSKKPQAWAELPREVVPRDLAPSQGVPLYAVKVLDGDTIQLQGGQRVRVLGVDCPERKRKDGKPGAEPGYQAATDLTWERVMAGPVKLSLGEEGQDAFGRWLAQVTLEDGKDLGTLLLEQGLARVYERARFDDLDDYKDLESEARERRVGIWAQAP